MTSYGMGNMWKSFTDLRYFHRQDKQSAVTNKTNSNRFVEGMEYVYSSRVSPSFSMNEHML